MNDIADIISNVLEIINSQIEDVTIQMNQIDKDLNSLGIDSIKFIQLIVALEETFKIEFPDEYLIPSEMGTVNKISNIVLTILKNTIPKDYKANAKQ